MINREQAKDLGVIWLARVTRFTFGWYWTPAQRAQLDQAEKAGRQTYMLHARRAPSGRRQ